MRRPPRLLSPTPSSRHTETLAPHHLGIAGICLVTAATAAFTGCGGGNNTGGGGAGGGGAGASTGAGGGTGGTAGAGGSTDGYIRGCGSLFAARIVEKQIEVDGAFPEDCDAPLTSAVGVLNNDGGTLCAVGESANACRQRLYDTPPSLASGGLGAGCAATTDGCLRGKWVAKCADGTDTGCAEPEAVCVDGTRPLVHMEAATAGPSSTWIIHMGGEGNPCSATKCWYDYRFRAMADQAAGKAMSSTHPEYPTMGRVKGGGVTAGSLGATNPFSAYNRVRFERCGDAASDRLETVTFGDGVPAAEMPENPPEPLPPETRSSQTVAYQKGFDTWRALLHALATSAGRDLDGDGTPDMPSMADATQVLLVASSDASVWLVHAADLLAAEVRGIAGPSVDVRILIDGYFEPGLDSAGRTHPSAPPTFNLFDNPYSATGLCALPDDGDPDNETCSDLTYRGGPMPDAHKSEREALDERGVRRDESCEATHGPNAPQCYDKVHVLLNHVSTPFLVLADQEDFTIGYSAQVQYADAKGYHYSAPGKYRALLLAQTYDVRALWHTAARDEGPGTPGDAVFVLPKSRRGNGAWSDAQHVRLDDDIQTLERGMSRCDSQGNKLLTASFGEAIHAWATGALPASFIVEDGVTWDGSSDYWITAAACAPPE